MASVRTHRAGEWYRRTGSAIYPGEEWNKIPPHEAGVDPAKLDSAKVWLDKHSGDRRYRVVVVRGGRLVANWNSGFGLNKKSYLFSRVVGRIGRDSSATARPYDIRLPLASAAKSIFSCILGIAIDEGKLPSADAKIIAHGLNTKL